MSAITRHGDKRPGNVDVVHRIRTKILAGEYGPEGRLVEEQIAGELGVSRTPVRQALTALEAEGLVEIAPNRGAIVASFSFDEVWDVYDLRAVLEGHAARRAAERIGEAELEKLRDLAEEMELQDLEAQRDDSDSNGHKERVGQLVDLNQQFHRTVVAASRNRRLEKLVQRTVQVPMVLKAYSWHLPEERAVSNHYHRKLIELLEAGDAQRAEMMMSNHVYEGRDVVLRALEEDQP